MKKQLIGICTALILLAGCDQEPRTDDVPSKAEESVVETNKDDYKTIVPQPTSEVRGVANNTIDTDLDLDQMETGLMDISKKYASVDQYIYQPGTIITGDEANLLVGREMTNDQFEIHKKTNPNDQNIGLNLPLESQKSGESNADFEKRQKETKIYVNTIIEQDYFTYDEKGNKKIEKIAIGFGMDPTYTYKDAEGKEHTVEIKDQELNDFANSYVANKMTEFIHDKAEEMSEPDPETGEYIAEDADIIYGFFKESETEMHPGTYYAEAQVKSGEDNLKDVQEINEQYYLFPTDEAEKFDPTLNEEIDEFEKDIRGYFPYNTGAYARGYYKDDKLQKIYIRLTVNVYSQVDLIPFVNFIEEKVKEKITENVEITVDIRRSSGEAEAIMNFDKNRNVDKYIY